MKNLFVLSFALLLFVFVEGYPVAGTKTDLFEGILGAAAGETGEN